MQTLLTSNRRVAAVLLTGAWTWAHAQSLGTPVADPLLGRPLEMSLPARFGAADGTDECVQADVFYGESRLKSADVRATVVGPVDQRRIRVEAAIPIDEPIVTVSVRAGCRGAVTRTYTLLPQYPSEQRLAAADARAAMATATPVAARKLAQVTAAAPRTRAGSGVPKAAVAAGPRLVLEPLEVRERDAILRASHALGQPAGDASRRAAAAALWHALNAGPQEVLRTTAMLQELDRDVAQLRQDTNETRAEMASLRARLDAAQRRGPAPGFVQALLLLLLAAGAGAGVLLLRTRRAAPATPLWAPRPEARSGQPAGARQEMVEAPQTVVPSPGDAQTAVDAVPAQPMEVPADADATLRVETLAATLGEADFLSSMGLLGEAMDVLKAYLQDSARPSPLAYLDLMQLCEQAEDPAGMASVRSRYAQTYGVEAPRLAQVARDGGLDTLPELAGRITRAWHGPDALSTLQDVLFSAPTPSAPVTLQAVRELLSLHALVLAETGASAGMHCGGLADGQPLAPWADAGSAQATQHALDELAYAEVGANPGLDLDLGAAMPAPLPEPEPSGRDLAPMLDKLQAASARELAQRRQRELEDAFSAAVASERIPASRY